MSEITSTEPRGGERPGELPSTNVQQPQGGQDEDMPQNWNGITRVGYLGPTGTFSHKAVLQDFEGDGFEHVPCDTISDIFQGVQDRGLEFGVVPLENSTNGAVTFALDMFADPYHLYEATNVCGESFVSVHHNVLGFSTGREHESSSGTATPTTSAPNPLKPKTKPLTDLSHIKRLYSHPQAWTQCEAFLSTYLKGVEKHDCSSTSKAAQTVAEDQTKSSASISCIAAADVYNLDILAKNVEDKPNNKTRFLTIRRCNGPSRGALPAYLAPGSAASSPNWRQAPPQIWKSLVSFTVDHNRAGALAGALQVFRDAGLNLTSINSRPSGQRNWHYIFFVEFMGRRDTYDVNQAMAKLDGVTEGCRMLGSFRDRSK